jgi:heme/copper-type cytochrome/quinol oxidase subunit 3
MSQTIAGDKSRRSEGGLLPPSKVEPPGNGGEPNRPQVPSGGEPLIGNVQLAMLVLIVSEAMYFAGLIGAFLIFRFSGQPWPPPFQPRLPVGITAVNTLFLVVSSYTFIQAQRGLKQDNRTMLSTYLTLTGALGFLFLAIQGYEWIQLLNFGLRISSGTYASIFYIIIGSHAVHVFCAVIWLGVVLVRAQRGHYSAQNQNGVIACGMYWHLVVGLWPLLFFLVYLL